MRLPMWFVSIRSLGRGDIFGILFALVLVAIVLYVSVKFPAPFGKFVVRGGFGPGWVCQYVPQDEPVCVRQVPKRSKAD